MKLFPAIDLRGGKAVRLYQGDYDRMTVYNDDPAAQARAFRDAGAKYLHVVDLDGAKDDDTANLPAVAAIAVGFRLIFLLLQLARPRPISEEIIWLEIVEIALLTAGGGLGMLLLTRRALVM